MAQLAQKRALNVAPLADKKELFFRVFCVLVGTWVGSACGGLASRRGWDSVTAAAVSVPGHQPRSFCRFPQQEPLVSLWQG